MSGHCPEILNGKNFLHWVLSKIPILIKDQIIYYTQWRSSIAGPCRPGEGLATVVATDTEYRSCIGAGACKDFLEHVGCQQARHHFGLTDDRAHGRHARKGLVISRRVSYDRVLKTAKVSILLHSFVRPCLRCNASLSTIAHAGTET